MFNKHTVFWIVGHDTQHGIIYLHKFEIWNNLPCPISISVRYWSIANISISIFELIYQTITDGIRKANPGNMWPCFPLPSAHLSICPSAHLPICSTATFILLPLGRPALWLKTKVYERDEDGQGVFLQSPIGQMENCRYRAFVYIWYATLASLHTLKLTHVFMVAGWWLQ